MEPDSVFMTVFCVFALLLWLNITGAGNGILELFNKESSWVWPNRIASLAQTVGVALVVVQLRLLFNEQARTTAALLRAPRLRAGVAESDVDAPLTETATVTATPHPTAGYAFQLYIVSENSGERSAHHVKWTVRSEPHLAHWDVSTAAWVSANREYDPDGTDRFEFSHEALHPTERQSARLRADLTELIPFDLLVRIAMDDAPLIICRLHVVLVLGQASD